MAGASSGAKRVSTSAVQITTTSSPPRNSVEFSDGNDAAAKTITFAFSNLIAIATGAKCAPCANFAEYMVQRCTGTPTTPVQGVSCSTFQKAAATTWLTI